MRSSIHFPKTFRAIQVLSNCFRSFRSVPAITNLLPHQLPIFKQRQPNVRQDPFIGPNNIRKDLIVSLRPHCPQASAFDERPNTPEFFEPNWQLLSKNNLDHIKSMPRSRVKAPRLKLVD
jgi:hypothetical protein